MLSVWPVKWRLFLPWLLYRLWPTQRSLQRAVSPLSAGPDADLIACRTRDRRFELAGSRAPTLLILAADDVFFSSARVERRARQVLPHLAGIEHLQGRHIPTGRSLERLNQIGLRFLKDQAG